jgi:hypothetical protein
VTFIEPALLQTSSFATSTSAQHFKVVVPATLGANQYRLEMSTDPLFGSSKIIQTTGFTPLQAISKTDPRQANALQANLVPPGNLMAFADIDLTKQFPGATQLFVRVGARDSRNGGGERLNPYVNSDIVQVPDGFLSS